MLIKAKDWSVLPFTKYTALFFKGTKKMSWIFTVAGHKQIEQ